MALTLGRPRLINREDSSSPPPLDIGYPKDPSRTLPLPSDSSPPLGISLFLSLAHKTHDVLSLSATGALARDYSKLVATHDDIFALRHAFPSEDQDPESNTSSHSSKIQLNALRLSFLSSVNTVLMTLHRPFIASQPLSRSESLSAALECLDFQQYIFSLVPHSQSATYGTVFATIETCIFLCGIMSELPPQDYNEEQRVLQAIVQGTSRLSIIKDRSALAESGERVLRQFYREIHSTRDLAANEPAWFDGDLPPVRPMHDGCLLDNIHIPPPQQPLRETFQSIFPSVEVPDEQFSFFGILDSDIHDALEDVLDGRPGELLPYCNNI